MPFGWYACNGQTFANTTKQAIALNSLPTGYRTDWGVVNSGAVTNVPNWAHTDAEGTRQPFARAVDGATRKPGSVENDALRDLAGIVGRGRGFGGSANGPFISTVVASGEAGSGGIATDVYQVSFDPSLISPVADENRPLNRGMTMAIYLGV